MIPSGTNSTPAEVLVEKKRKEKYRDYHYVQVIFKRGLT
jgi:hypothetical protein